MGRKDELREQALGDGTIVSINHDSFADEILHRANELAKSLEVPTKITYEASGHHQYVPCPACISEIGRQALDEPKLAINWDKYLGKTKDYEYLNAKLSPWQAAQANKNAWEKQKSVCCMRALGSNSAMGDNIRHFITVEELMNMGSLKKQFPELSLQYREAKAIQDKVKEANWVEDPATGEMVPPPPGQVIPLSQLWRDYGDNHPVFAFLRQRGFEDWAAREKHMRLGFCVSEWPHGKNKVWQRKIDVDGWHDTPQNRLILYTVKNGVPVNWQARVLEWVSDDGLHKFALHPYRSEWVHTHSRPSREAAWIGVGLYSVLKPNGRDLWDPSKYKTATHSYRETAPMGWDAAIEFNLTQDVRWGVIGEGPLDALRVGPPGMAALGKTLPGRMPRMIAEHFEVIFTMFDNDAAGKRATEQIKNQLMRAGGCIREVIPINIGFGCKDVGEMTDEQWRQTIEPLKTRYLI